ncbi:MAG: 4Fe-4S binding protein [Methanobrevibacter sp.]|nr:4Fe-4S binding protein [Candidatus Methanovirga meridionalis]
MKIDESNCGKCGICTDACPLGLIEKQGFKIIIKEGCNNCGMCLEVCPMDVIYEE